MRAVRPIDIDSDEWRGVLGASLREARMRRGLSLRQAAAILDISPQTVLEAEGGSDVRSSTLRRYLERLPGLTPAKVLGLPPGRVPVATPTAWATYRDLCGYVARAVRVTVRELPTGERLRTTTITGLRSLHAPMTDPTVRKALGRLAAVGSPKGLLKLEGWKPGATLRLREGGATHAWRIPRDLGRGIDYTVREVVPEGTTPTWDRMLPAEELELCLRPKGGLPAAGTLRCRPAATADEADVDVAETLYPKGVEVKRSPAGLIARVPMPAPLVEHALVALDAEPVRPPRYETLAGSIRFRRRELGLGLKLAARRMGCSHVGLRAIELGSDARASLVRRAVVGLEVPLDQTLPPGVVEGSGDLHDWVRDLYGVEANAVVKTVVIAPDGKADISIETRGLRALRPPETDVRLRMGLARAVLQRSPAVLSQIEADMSDVKLRVVSRKDGAVQHELRFPVGEGLRRGISYTRRFQGCKQFCMTVEEARAKTGVEDDRYETGTSIAVLHPTKRLTVSVRFPRAFTPKALSPRAWPIDMVPEVDHPPLHSIPAMKVSLGRTERHLVATLTVETPIVGFKYGIGWALRD